MNLSTYYWYFTSVIPPRVCDNIIMHGLSKPESMARTGGYDNKELSNDELKSRVDAAILSIRDPPTRYTQEANSFLYSILNDIPFEYDELVIDELQNITLDDIRYSYCEWILGEEYTDSSEISGNIERGSCSFGRRSVSVQLWGGEHKGEPAKAKDRGDTLGASAGCALFNHDDLHAFKASLPYFNAEILKFKI